MNEKTPKGPKQLAEGLRKVTKIRKPSVEQRGFRPAENVKPKPSPAKPPKK